MFCCFGARPKPMSSNGGRRLSRRRRERYPEFTPAPYSETDHMWDDASSSRKPSLGDMSEEIEIVSIDKFPPVEWLPHTSSPLSHKHKLLIGFKLSRFLIVFLSGVFGYCKSVKAFQDDIGAETLRFWTTPAMAPILFHFQALVWFFSFFFSGLYCLTCFILLPTIWICF